MDIQDALDRFLLQLEADGRSPHTIGQYRRHVLAFARWLEQAGHSGEVEEIGHEDVARFLAAPEARRRADGGPKKAASMNTLRTSLQGFFGFLHRAGIVPEDPARLVRRARCGPPLPRALTEDERARLLEVLEREAPERDRVLFRLMLGAGLRVGSAVGLDVEDVDLGQGELRLRRAKGDREERAVLPAAVRHLLGAFLEGRTPGPVFAGRRGGRLTVRHVQRLFQGYARAAGIRTTSTHVLRHTMATRLYRRTRDILLVKQALRHRSLESTLVYAQVEDRRLREALRA